MNKVLKSSVVGAFVALGLVANSVQTAQAGGSFGFHFGNGKGSIHIDIGHHGKKYGKWAHCSAGEALHRAATIGVKKRWIQKVTHNRIVVRGKKGGHPVRVVINRHSPHCKVQNFTYV